ncbi:hypothetical protein [Sphingomonas caeni]|uniref:hypothetical protein n=1 Tax=Sphingomonas caeni TaxID=2984949 RepID=UPI00222E1440|nr:hypothetical protein [Sphingomonas caeni]
MARLRIEISASPSSNDYQARPFLNDQDWLGRDHLGLDPPELVAELTDTAASEVLIGRCGCGVVGCDDVRVAIARSAASIDWLYGGRRVHFDPEQYNAEIRRFAADESWRPVERQVERAVEELFRGLVLEDRLEFRWASARIKRNIVHLSFDRCGLRPEDHEQRILEFSWDGESVESARDRALSFRRERFDS